MIKISTITIDIIMVYLLTHFATITIIIIIVNVSIIIINTINNDIINYYNFNCYFL